MESTFSLLKYFQRIRENFDNLDVIEEFGVNEALKYDPNDPDYLEKLRASYDETDGYRYDETQEQEDTSATSETPASGTPDSGTPDSGTPDSETPDSGTPDSETPDSETPDSETPDSGTPANGTPANPETETTPTTPEELAAMNGGSPATPNSENIFQDQQNANIVPPTSETPTSETPTSETPTSETPTSETPTSETPTSETPTSETPSTSNIETPTKLPSTIAPPVILPEDTPSNDLPQATIPGQCSSKDLFDFNCYKNLKILLWFLLILITIVIIAFFLYLVNKLVRINNNTPTIKTVKSSSPQTIRLEKVDSSPEPKPFLSRLFGFKDDSADSKSKSSSRKKK